MVLFPTRFYEHFCPGKFASVLVNKMLHRFSHRKGAKDAKFCKNPLRSLRLCGKEPLQAFDDLSPYAPGRYWLKSTAP